MADRAPLRRTIGKTVAEAVRNSRIAFLGGPRRAGKTTLVRQIATELDAEYQTLDDRTVRDFALDDPTEFLERDRLLIIDEVQRGGDDLLLAIQAHVDHRDRPGQFLLTGSTRFLTVPKLSESLAGRIDLIDLWPFSQGELDEHRDVFVDRIFGLPRNLRRRRPPPVTRAAAFERVCRDN